jgi:uncharacterized protein YutE (UPF0331/DUF86 family)
MKNQKSLMDARECISYYLNDIQKMGLANPTLLDDEKNYCALSMLLFVTITEAGKLAKKIASLNGLNVSENYVKSFESLSRNGIIDADMGTKLVELCHDRSMIEWEFQKLNRNDILNIYHRLAIIVEFSRTVEKYENEN